jgi:hypothetical protein
MVNQKAFDALPADYKSALEVACYEATIDMVANYDTLNPLAPRRLVAGGTQLRAFPRDVMEACWKAAHELYDETASKNPKFRKVYEAWRAYRDDRSLWFSVAETRLDRFMQSMSARRSAPAREVTATAAPALDRPAAARPDEFDAVLAEPVAGKCAARREAGLESARFVRSTS